MRITDIQRTKRGRYSVFIDDDFYGVLHVDVYMGGQARIGSLISEEALDELIHQSQILIAKERALRLLSARSYTSKALKEKLMRDVGEAEADIIIERMQDLGLIDDEDYAIRYAKDCINLRGYSHKRLVGALYQKGISREVIEATLARLGQEDQERQVVKLVEKKYINKIDDEANLRKTINAIMRKGFSYDEIKKVLNNINEDKEYYKGYWEE